MAHRHPQFLFYSLSFLFDFRGKRLSEWLEPTCALNLILGDFLKLIYFHKT